MAGSATLTIEKSNITMNCALHNKISTSKELAFGVLLLFIVLFSVGSFCEGVTFLVKVSIYKTNSLWSLRALTKIRRSYT